MELVRRATMKYLDRRILTKAVRRDILDRLDRMRLRLKKAGGFRRIARVAAVQSFLMDDLKDPIWTGIGLVQVIYNRSVHRALDLAGTSDEVFDDLVRDAKLSGLPAPVKRVAQSGLVKGLERFSQNLPGLGKPDEPADEIEDEIEIEIEDEVEAEALWEQGLLALDGLELNLALYANEELQSGYDIICHILEEAPDVEIEDEAQQSTVDETTLVLIDKLARHQRQFLTVPRRTQMVRDLLAAIDQQICPPKWIPFILLVCHELTDEEVSLREKRFFLNSFVCEIRTASMSGNVKSPWDETGSEAESPTS
jgi:hypothetical protein